MSVSETVKSAGDSWIICRSKSYSGRIYYFNTLSGKAVWNLSEPEIEKAKNTTKVLLNRPDFQIPDCPEPSESPQDSEREIPLRQIIQPKIYNKQVINNSFPKSLEKSHFLSYAQLTPIQLNVPVTPINSNVWNVTPEPIIVTPTRTSQIPLLMNNHNYLPLNTSISLSTRFKNLSESDAKSQLLPRKPFNKIYVRKDNFSGFSKKKMYINKQQAIHKTDLRTLLTSKRRNFAEESEDCILEQFSEQTSSKTSSPALYEPNNDTIPYDADDAYWLQENLGTQGKITKIDTTSLHNLLQVNNSSFWYIVTDSNVFLNHVNFLNILMKSDSQCRLMIPQQVMNKIKLATNSRLRTQAHKAAYFISEKVDENIAIIDLEENVLYNDSIFNSCTKLIEEGKPVVIITDDIELHSTECSIPMYTVMEIKKILNDPHSHGIPNPKNLKNVSIKHSRNIKITIENDAIKDILEQQTDYDNKVIKDTTTFESEQDEEVERFLNQPDVQNEYVINNLKSLEKKTDDIGVQPGSSDLMVQDIYNENDTSNVVENDHSTELAETKSNNLKRKSSFDIAKLNVAEKYLKQNKIRMNSSMSFILENSTTEEQKEPPESHPTELESVAYSDNRRFISKNKCHSLIKETSNIDVIRSAKTLENVTQDTIESEELNKLQQSENVMFEVTSQAMEDYLKMKCDEWTSRFVQIMEEVLTQVLQIDPPYVLDTMPSPWNIYEATECVKRKFNNVDDIHDATTKLSSLLFEFGASRGKIKTDISPGKYMEMYSYGVYLIDTLQGHLSNIEDLHTAEQALAKLLRDIQDPHLDLSNHDLFIDTNAENQTICNEQDTLNETVESMESVINNKTLDKSSDSTSKSKISNNTISSSYRLRSHRRRLNLQEQENKNVQEITFIRNIDIKSSFFTNLNLKKNVVNNDEIQSIINNVTNGSEVKNNKESNDNEMENDIEVLNNEQVQDEVENVNMIDNYSATNVVKDNVSEESKSNTPQIIRNFTKCIEFENKLKSKNVESEIMRDNWLTQSESDYTGNEELDYEDEYFYDNDYGSYEYDYEENELLVDKMKNKNDNFKLFIEKIKHEIRTTFLGIHSYCTTSYETLSSSDIRESKLKIQNVGKKILAHVNSLCVALSSILSRDASDCVYRLKELLKIDSIDDSVIDDDHFEAYRVFIKMSVQQGNLLIDSIKLVIDACEE